MMAVAARDVTPSPAVSMCFGSRRMRLFSFALLAVIGFSSHSRAADCASLAKANIDQLAITESALYTPQGQATVCRIRATAVTSDSSSIRVEVWLPEQHWNHRFLATDWASYAGSLSEGLLKGPAAEGYATATTDGGGIPGHPNFFLGNVEKVRDWGERAWHVTTLAAKALIVEYYGEPVRFAYWSGGGGAARQGLKEAQRYPADYDGIVVGGLAHDSSHFAFAQIAAWQAVHNGGTVRASVLPLLHEKVVAACDDLDGINDGLISNPERCHFDPARLQCHGDLRDDCLSATEVAAFRRLYAPVQTPRAHRPIFGGLMPGSELNWKSIIEEPEPGSYALDFFKYIVFADPNWDYRSLDFDRDLTRAERVDPSVNGLNPDLRPYFKRGGKLLIWGGWADNAIPPSANTGYYRAVMKKLGPTANSSIRLFMIPGMAHFPNRRGPNAFDFDTQPVIEDWREQGQIPQSLMVSHWSDGAMDRNFAVCPYPELPACNSQCGCP